MSPIRVLLVDDQELFLEGLQTVLEKRAPDIEVVATARDGREAVDCVKREHPDIVLMDVRMPNLDGVEAARILQEEAPKVRVVMLTTFDDDEYVHDALRHGVVGYLLKNIPPGELIAAIRAVRSGAVLISPSIAAGLVSEPADPDRADDSRGIPREIVRMLDTLTRREKEILPLVLQAYTNEEIAERLFIAEQTVKNHVSTLYAKLGMRDRVHLLKTLGGTRIQELLRHL